MFEMFRFVGAAFALALMAGSVLAQTPSQPGAGHLAAARDLVLASGMQRSFDLVIPQLEERLRQSALTRPEIRKDLDAVLQSLKPEMEQQRQVMVNSAARVFAGQMNEAELKEIATFFKSPVGARYVQTQPAVLDALVREMQEWSETVAEYMLVRVRAEMGKRGHILQ